MIIMIMKHDFWQGEACNASLFGADRGGGLDGGGSESEIKDGLAGKGCKGRIEEVVRRMTSGMSRWWRRARGAIKISPLKNFKGKITGAP